MLERPWSRCYVDGMVRAARKHPSDVNQLAYATVQQATGEAPAKNPAAIALGKLGGAKGGKARAAALSAKRRSAIAKKAARARWGKNGSA